MAIPEPIETFMMRLGFRYKALHHPEGASVDEPPRHAEGEATTHAFFADHAPILVLVPAGSRVELERLKHTAQTTHLRAVTADEAGGLYPESEPGAMPPLGPLYGQRVYVDEALTHDEHVVFSGGTRHDAIRMRYGDFAELVHPIVGRFAVRKGGAHGSSHR